MPDGPAGALRGDSVTAMRMGRVFDITPAEWRMRKAAMDGLWRQAWMGTGCLRGTAAHLCECPTRGSGQGKRGSGCAAEPAEHAEAHAPSVEAATILPLEDEQKKTPAEAGVWVLR